MRDGLLACVLLGTTLPGHADTKRDAHLIDKFRQLGTELRDPNVYRNAAGAPGPDYWQ